MKIFLRAARRRGKKYKARVAHKYRLNIRDPREDYEYTRLMRDLHRMNKQPSDLPLYPLEYNALLGLAGSLGALNEGTQVHMHIIKCRLQRFWKTVVHLIRMYGRCKCPSRAIRCFEYLHTKKPPTWAALIIALAENGKAKLAKSYFERMLTVPIKPDEDCFTSALHTCFGARSLEYGRDLHARIGLNGFDSDPSFCNGIISMYGRCEAMEPALEIFQRMGPKRDALSWISLIAAYAQNGHLEEVSHYTRVFLLEGVLQPSKELFIKMLKRCQRKWDLFHGEVIHGLISTSSLDSDLLVRQSLMKMYGRCGKVKKARQLFDEIENPDAFLWNTIIRAYAGEGSKREVALKMFEKMKESGVKPTQETLFTVLSVCKSFQETKSVHAYVVFNKRMMGKVMKDLIIQKYENSQEVPDAWEKYRQLQARFKQNFY